MSKAPTKEHSKPLSVRFTDTEKALLQSKAGNLPLGPYIRKTVLGDESGPRRTLPRPVRDAEALGRLLGLLGQSRLANNLNQLAKAANQGSLPVTEETETELRQACAEIFEMRLLLLQALGLRILDEAIPSPPLANAFTAAAGGSGQ